MQNTFSWRVLSPFVILAALGCDPSTSDDLGWDIEASDPASPNGDDRESADADPANIVVVNEDNLVDLFEAEQLAEDLAAAKFGRAQGPAITRRHVEYDQETGLPSLYVFNFEGGGFVLVAGDKRQVPILGYSDSNEFETEGLSTGQAPEGVLTLVEINRLYIEDVRLGLADEVSNVEAFEEEVERVADLRLQQEGSTSPFEPPDPETCQTSYSRTYQLNFPMRWDQGCNWNAQAPLASDGPCGRAWAGCVAVAVGQVMKYHAYPTNIAWSSMSNTAATTSSAQLLRQIGDRVGMDWGGDGSSADSADIDNVLEGYGYSTSANYQSHSFSAVLSEIRAGRPVIMRGEPDCGWFSSCSGHAWVVTGVQDNYDCATQTYPWYYQMNWGWGGSYNGWYRVSSISPAGRNYNYDKRIVVGIKR